MSKFFSKKLSSLVPYVPGEQPKDKKYIKLNTNESPFAPSSSVLEAVKTAAGTLNLYSDPECTALRAELSRVTGVPAECLVMTNGSDEILDFSFNAFADEERPLLFPDITYGFYSVFAEYNRIPYKTVPLNDKLEIDIDDYIGKKSVTVIANPNAPTGKYIPLSEIERLVKNSPDSIIIIDEAYIDFGGESAISLVPDYPNLLVTRTFSKSRSLAGARLGFGVAQKELINDIKTIIFSTNPYNVNSLTSAAGVATLKEDYKNLENCRTIIENREYFTNELIGLGFEVIPSMTNFVFAKTDKISGKDLYLTLKEHGILVRHFDNPRICEYNRITIGTREQMDALLKEIITILKGI